MSAPMSFVITKFLISNFGQSRERNQFVKTTRMLQLLITGNKRHAVLNTINTMGVSKDG